MAKATLNRVLKIKIPLKEFPCQGIAEFTLFTDRLLPVAERLVYIHPEKKLHIEALPDKDRYETRGKVQLKIKVTDDQGQPVVANLGINVYDKLYRNTNDPVNILSHCFLTSQLRGKIYDPAYYFDEKNNDRDEALDLLLLTQGWRRYVWSETALRENSNKNRPIIFDGITGEAHVTRQLKKSKGIQQFVMAFNPGSNNNKDFIVPDSAGRFTVTPEHLQVWQGGYVYLKPMAREEFMPRISIAEPFGKINEITKTKEINYPFPAVLSKKIENTGDLVVEGHGTVKLAEVTVKGTGISTFRDKYLGHLDSIAKSDYCMDYVCVSGYLNCPIHENDKKNTKPIDGKSYKRYEGFKWLNGSGSGPYTFSSESQITYSYPKFTEEELLTMNNLSRIKAYYAHREFYEPKYDNSDSLNDPLPDFRNTLLWEPMIVTNEKGEATLEFFCSDINTRFVGNIEGVTEEGLLGKSNFEFNVYNPKLSK
ncbi:hypothetical protein [Paludibacter sp.]|uniref:hypothetical protein n=1 Tax=Paludibacter sp. TaxID=1898105 RepID=UPI001353A64F|nr:hypothetical protein [Paludibacter sp.]MTK52151.1 hypothetical protein [Paludibacter sp.]